MTTSPFLQFVKALQKKTDNLTDKCDSSKIRAWAEVMTGDISDDSMITLKTMSPFTPDELELIKIISCFKAPLETFIFEDELYEEIQFNSN